MKWNKVDFLHASYAEVAVSQARGSVLLKKDMLLQTHIGSVGSEYLPRKRFFLSPHVIHLVRGITEVFEVRTRH